jgi:hypothetical protein
LVGFKSEWEDLAIGLLNTYDNITNDTIRDVLIIRYIPLFGMDCLKLAVHCGCKKLLSTPIIDNILDDIWNDKKIDKDSFDELVDYVV